MTANNGETDAREKTLSAAKSLSMQMKQEGEALIAIAETLEPFDLETQERILRAVAILLRINI